MEATGKLLGCRPVHGRVAAPLGVADLAARRQEGSRVRNLYTDGDMERGGGGRGTEGGRKNKEMIEREREGRREKGEGTGEGESEDRRGE